MIYALYIWVLLGFIGYCLYLSNKETRPKKIYLLPVALMTHLCFGVIGLLYGYVCFSSRNNDE